MTRKKQLRTLLTSVLYQHMHIETYYENEKLYGQYYIDDGKSRGILNGKITRFKKVLIKIISYMFDEYPIETKNLTNRKVFNKEVKVLIKILQEQNEREIKKDKEGEQCINLSDFKNLPSGLRAFMSGVILTTNLIATTKEINLERDSTINKLYKNLNDKSDSISNTLISFGIVDFEE